MSPLMCGPMARTVSFHSSEDVAKCYTWLLYFTMDWLWFRIKTKIGSYSTVLVFLCNVSFLYCFQDTIIYFPKFKEVSENFALWL